MKNKLSKIALIMLSFALLLCACTQSEPDTASSSSLAASNSTSIESSPSTAPFNIYPTEWDFTNGTRTIPSQTVRIGDVFLDWKLTSLHLVMEESILATFEGEITAKGVIVFEERYPFGYCCIFYPDDDSLFPRSKYDEREGGIFCVLREKSVYDEFGTNGIVAYPPNEFFGINELEECQFECEIVMVFYKVNNKLSAVADIGVVSKIISQEEKQPVTR